MFGIKKKKKKIIIIIFYKTRSVFALHSLSPLTSLTFLYCGWLRTEVGWRRTFFSLEPMRLRLSRSTWIRLGCMPETRAAFTTAQFSEFWLTSRISPPPRARTNPAETHQDLNSHTALIGKDENRKLIFSINVHCPPKVWKRSRKVGFWTILAWILIILHW